MIRKDKIINVEKFMNKVNDNYEYRKELKIFGITIRKSGIYVLPIVASAYLKDPNPELNIIVDNICLLYTSDAADDTPCVDLGGRRIIKKKGS